MSSARRGVAVITQSLQRGEDLAVVVVLLNLLETHNLRQEVG